MYLRFHLYLCYVCASVYVCLCVFVCVPICAMRVSCAAMVEEEPKVRTSGVPPMMKLKDKLYRKNEKLYDSFGMFDIDKIGQVTTVQFADTIDRLNVHFAPPPLCCFSLCLLCSLALTTQPSPCSNRYHARAAALRSNRRCHFKFLVCMFGLRHEFFPKHSRSIFRLDLVFFLGARFIRAQPPSFLGPAATEKSHWWECERYPDEWA